ncbi:uncharacterized protein JCM6883_000201 [Sporobolomyces salmoneus]|uniref:uncharacterized protein n=1 Tax=Sporobolomyces salmoneus TaxID=183962 RepID=UPI003179230E
MLPNPNTLFFDKAAPSSPRLNDFLPLDTSSTRSIQPETLSSTSLKEQGLSWTDPEADHTSNNSFQHFEQFPPSVSFPYGFIGDSTQQAEDRLGERGFTSVVRELDGREMSWNSSNIVSGAGDTGCLREVASGSFIPQTGNLFSPSPQLVRFPPPSSTKFFLDESQDHSTWLSRPEEEHVPLHQSISNSRVAFNSSESLPLFDLSCSSSSPKTSASTLTTTSPVHEGPSRSSPPKVVVENKWVKPNTMTPEEYAAAPGYPFANPIDFLDLLTSTSDKAENFWVSLLQQQRKLEDLPEFETVDFFDELVMLNEAYCRETGNRAPSGLFTERVHQPPAVVIEMMNYPTWRTDRETATMITREAGVGFGFEPKSNITTILHDLHRHRADNGELKSGRRYLPSKKAEVDDRLACEFYRISSEVNTKLVQSRAAPPPGRLHLLLAYGNHQHRELRESYSTLVKHAEAQGREIRVVSESFELPVPEFISADQIIKATTETCTITYVQENEMYISAKIDVPHPSSFSRAGPADLGKAVLTDSVWAFIGTLNLAADPPTPVPSSRQTSIAFDSILPAASPSSFRYRGVDYPLYDLDGRNLREPKSGHFVLVPQDSWLSRFTPVMRVSRTAAVNTCGGESLIIPHHIIGPDGRSQYQTTMEDTTRYQLSDGTACNGWQQAAEKRSTTREENRKKMQENKRLEWERRRMQTPDDPEVKDILDCRSGAEWYKRRKYTRAKKEFEKLGGMVLYPSSSNLSFIPCSHPNLFRPESTTFSSSYASCLECSNSSASPSYLHCGQPFLNSNNFNQAPYGYPSQLDYASNQQAMYPTYDPYGRPPSAGVQSESGDVPPSLSNGSSSTASSSFPADSPSNPPHFPDQFSQPPSAQYNQWQYPQYHYSTHPYYNGASMYAPPTSYGLSYQLQSSNSSSIAPNYLPPPQAYPAPSIASRYGYPPTSYGNSNNGGNNLASPQQQQMPIQSSHEETAPRQTSLYPPQPLPPHQVGSYAPLHSPSISHSHSRKLSSQPSMASPAPIWASPPPQGHSSTRMGGNGGSQQYHPSNEMSVGPSSVRKRDRDEESHVEPSGTKRRTLYDDHSIPNPPHSQRRPQGWALTG